MFEAFLAIVSYNNNNNIKWKHSNTGGADRSSSHLNLNWESK